MTRRPTVATIVAAGSQPFEFGVVAEVFGFDRSELGVPWYLWTVCAADVSPVPMQGGLTVDAPGGPNDVRAADTVIVTPGDPDDYSDEMLDAIRRAHARGARIVSLCTGAFPLAATGLLDGRRATTHWMHADRLRQLHPAIEIDPAVLYVEDGNILTSAGTAASIDLCLHLVRLDFGAEIANAVARRMVVPPHRDGGQAQYVDHPIDEQPGNELFAATLEWAESNLRESITVDDMADRSAMSPRTFARRFSATTGTTPHHWITRQRVQLAQRLLETTDLSVEHVASESGLGTASNLRIHFQRIVQTTPSRYRATFRVDQPA